MILKKSTPTLTDPPLAARFTPPLSTPLSTSASFLALPAPCLQSGHTLYTFIFWWESSIADSRSRPDWSCAANTPQPYRTARPQTGCQPCSLRSSPSSLLAIAASTASFSLSFTLPCYSTSDTTPPHAITLLLHQQHSFLYLPGPNCSTTAASLSGVVCFSRPSGILTVS